MSGTVVVWDIETVPDLLAAKRDDEVRAEMGDKFPKLMIIYIGALVAISGSLIESPTCLPYWSHLTEPLLICRYCAIEQWSLE